jgi:hypothetical protein
VKKKKLVKYIAVIAFGLLMTGSLLIILVRLTPIPPVDQIREALFSISAAKHARAETFSSDLMKEAQTAYDSALVLWKDENNKWIFLRNYSQVIEYAGKAEKLAGKARQNALKDKNNLRFFLMEAMDSIEVQIEFYKPWWKTLPVQGSVRVRYEQSLLLFSEAKMAFNHSDYSNCQSKLQQAGNGLNETTLTLDTLLEGYFQMFPQWVEMAEKTIRESRSKRAILIDKFAAKCYLYQHGKQVRSYQVELGINWIGDKRHQGDKATPEGEYKVIGKKKGAETKYYKALLLNYPNEQDHHRFKMEIKNGTLSDGSQIGGMIEIHGGGGRGMHWTDGCIALTDSEMDFLYDFVSTNTPVTIVGSLVSFEELKKSIADHETVDQ